MESLEFVDMAWKFGRVGKRKDHHNSTYAS